MKASAILGADGVLAGTLLLGLGDREDDENGGKMAVFTDKLYRAYVLWQSLQVDARTVALP